MIEWVLVALIQKYESGPTSVVIPGFQSIEDCHAAAKTINDDFRDMFIRYSCIPQTKK
jgi:hypothetical protein